MSEGVLSNHQRRNGRKPDYKIRPGFSDDELAEFDDFLKHSSINPGRFAKKLILDEIRKRPIGGQNEQA